MTEVEEKLYYPCSENKGADQLRSYCEADLRLCFRIDKNLIFSQCGSFKKKNSYALVICNHGPPAPGNSGDFDFWSRESPLKPLLFSPAACYFSFHCPFCLYKANPWYFPRTAVTKLWSKHRSFPRLSPALPQGPWLQMTSALIIILSN